MSSDGWYPGKNLKQIQKKIQERKKLQEEGNFEPTKRPLITLRNALKEKRPLSQKESTEGQLGKLVVSLISGSFNTSRPYLILSLNGNEMRTETAKSNTPQWDKSEVDSNTKFTFPIFDACSDLCIFLFDDCAIKNQICIGRVIIPLRSLCTESYLPMPKPEHRATFSIMPASTQHCEDLQARYHEAVPHVPGSGMVKPVLELGWLVLQLHMSLTVKGSEHLGLLAAYAKVDPKRQIKENGKEVGSDLEDRNKLHQDQLQTDQKPAAKLKPKIIRLNKLRIQRSLGKPYLLKEPWCFGLFLVHYWICFHSVMYQLPWLFFALVFVNGLLGDLHCKDRTKDMIFWEEAVGESDMPKGLGKFKFLLESLANLQKRLGVGAAWIERSQNLFNFSDPPVTLVAFGLLTLVCAISSLVLIIIPAHIIFFMLGCIAIAPSIRRKLPLSSSTDTPKNEKIKTQFNKKNVILQTIRMAMNVVSRVPDGKDIAHQYFCTQQRK